MQPQGSSLCLSLAQLIFIASTQGLADLSSPARRLPGSGRCQKMHESRQRPVATWRGGHGGRPAQLAPTRPTKDRPQRGGGFERASASQRPRATWPRRAAHPPCRCSAGATDLRPQPCRGRQRCCWLCSGDVSVRNGALQPNQRLAADQSPRARTALARSCPVGPPGPRGLSPDAGAECGSIPQRPALRAGAARCRLCRVRRPPSLLAGRVGVAAGVVSCRVYLWGPCGKCRARVPCRSASPPSASSTEEPPVEAPIGGRPGEMGRCQPVTWEDVRRLPETPGDSSPRAPGRASVRRWSWGVSEGSCTLS